MEKMWSYLIEADYNRRKEFRKKLVRGDLTQHDKDVDAIRYGTRKWTKQKIDISVAANIRVPRNAEVLQPLGVFAVHRTLSGNSYTVTHVPTGFSPCSMFKGKGSKNLAKSFAVAMEDEALAMGSSFSLGNFGTHPSDDVLDTFAKIVVRASRKLKLSDDMVTNAVRRCIRRNLLDPKESK